MLLLDDIPGQDPDEVRAMVQPTVTEQDQAATPTGSSTRSRVQQLRDWAERNQAMFDAIIAGGLVTTAAASVYNAVR